MIIASFKSVITVQQPIIRYLAIGILVAIVPSLLILFLIGIVWPSAIIARLATTASGDLFFYAVVLEPAVMTLLLWPLTMVIKNQTNNKLALTALLCSFVCALLIGFIEANLVVLLLWAYFIFSLCFMTWEKHSRIASLAMTFLVHSAHNFVVVLILQMVV